MKKLAFIALLLLSFRNVFAGNEFEAPAMETVQVVEDTNHIFAKRMVGIYTMDLLNLKKYQDKLAYIKNI